MIWRWVICFNLLLLVGQAASVRGRISIIKDKNSKVQSGDLPGTVIWLEPLSSELLEPRKSAARFQILQKDKTFEPHVLAIPVGATVEFPNLDPIFHNAFSNYDGQVFDVALYPPGTSRSVKFRRPGIVRVFCNIHSSMSAIVVVLRSPYFGTTDEDGEFHIDDVPKGRYRLEVYHERATEQTLENLAREIEVDRDEMDAGDVAITESGFLAIPHLNKYGKPYESADDGSAYPGARK
jgi:plastocyanin